MQSVHMDFTWDTLKNLDISEMKATNVKWCSPKNDRPQTLVHTWTVTMLSPHFAYLCILSLKCSCGKITQNESCSPNFSGAHHRYQKQVSVRMSLLVVALASDLIFYEDISAHSPKPTSNPLRVLASAWSMFHRCTSGLAWNVVL